MKLTTPLLVLTLLIPLSCKTDVEEKAQAEIVNSNEVAAPSPVRQVESRLQSLRGTYVGYPNTSEFIRGRLSGHLNLTIEKFNEEDLSISGYRILEGKKTLFEGKYEFDEKSNVLILTQKNEKLPYRLEVKKDGSQLILTHGKFEKAEMTKRIFKYDPTNQVRKQKAESTILNASTEKLKDADLQNMAWVDLNLIKNAIYARHGKAFKESRNIYFFEISVDWYAPFFLDVDDKLTELEKENIVLLEKFEKNVPKPKYQQEMK